MAVDITNMNRKQLDSLRNKIDTREKDMRKKDLAELRERLSKAIKDKGFTVDEVFPRRAKRATKRTGKVPPKYRNPKDSDQTWSGRGKRPHWFNDAIAAGKKPESMLIKK